MTLKQGAKDLTLFAGKGLLSPIDRFIRCRVHRDVASGTNVQIENALLSQLGFRPSRIGHLARTQVVGCARDTACVGELDGLAAVVLEREPVVELCVPELTDTG